MKIKEQARKLVTDSSNPGFELADEPEPASPTVQF